MIGYLQDIQQLGTHSWKILALSPETGPLMLIMRAHCCPCTSAQAKETKYSSSAKIIFVLSFFLGEKSENGEKSDLMHDKNDQKIKN